MCHPCAIPEASYLVGNAQGLVFFPLLFIQRLLFNGYLIQRLCIEGVVFFCERDRSRRVYEAKERIHDLQVAT